MATKYLEMFSTRHTAIGSLRKGIIYPLNDNDRRVPKIIAAMTDTGTKGKPQNPAGQLLTAKQVEEKRAAVESFDAKAEAVDAKAEAMRGKVNAQEEVAQAKKTLTEMGKGLEAAKKAMQEHERTIADLRAENARLAEAAKAQADRADNAKAKEKS